MDIFILIAFDIPFGALLWVLERFFNLIGFIIKVAAFCLPFALLWAYIWVI